MTPTGRESMRATADKGQVETPSISASVPDWNRERCRRWWDPGRRLLKCLRDYARWRRRGGVLGRLMARTCVPRHILWSVMTGADIPLNCEIGGGLLIPHPNGIVIHPHARIGPNCLIFQQVTLGTRGGPEAPAIGGHVDIGAGARVLGGVTIGDHAVIGANAVVIADVPPHTTVVGIPARPLH